jgi:hypothetical protein
MSGAPNEPFLIRRILSGAQSGVEAGALDLALKLGLECGGWVPRGFRSAGSPLPAAYQLKETPSADFKDAVEFNARDSDGTLLLTRGKKNPHIKYAIQMALKHQKQLLNLDMRQYPIFEAGSMISTWISMQFIKSVYVTGNSREEDESIYQMTQKALETAVYLGFVKSGAHPQTGGRQLEISSTRMAQYPQTIAEAVEQLKKALPLKDRTLMANMQPHQLEHLHSGLGEYIKQNFGLYAGNSKLLQACAQAGQIIRPLPDEAAAVILRALWKNLQATHRLRVIK